MDVLGNEMKEVPIFPHYFSHSYANLEDIVFNNIELD